MPSATYTLHTPTGPRSVATPKPLLKSESVQSAHAQIFEHLNRNPDLQNRPGLDVTTAFETAVQITQTRFDTAYTYTVKQRLAARLNELKATQTTLSDDPKKAFLGFVGTAKTDATLTVDLKEKQNISQFHGYVWRDLETNTVYYQEFGANVHLQLSQHLGKQTFPIMPPITTLSIQKTLEDFLEELKPKPRSQSPASGLQHLITDEVDSILRHFQENTEQVPADHITTLKDLITAFRTHETDDERERAIGHILHHFEHLLRGLPGGVKEKYVEGFVFLLRDGPDDLAYAIEQSGLPNFLNQLGIFCLFFWAANTLKDADSLPATLMAIGSVFGCIKAGLTFALDTHNNTLGFGDGTLAGIDLDGSIKHAYESASGPGEQAIVVLAGLMGVAFCAGSITAAMKSTAELYHHIKENGIDKDALFGTIPIVGSGLLSTAQMMTIVSWIKGGLAGISPLLGPVLVGVGATLVLGYAIYESVKTWKETLNIVTELTTQKAEFDILSQAFEATLKEMELILEKAKNPPPSNAHTSDESDATQNIKQCFETVDKLIQHRKALLRHDQQAIEEAPSEPPKPLAQVITQDMVPETFKTSIETMQHTTSQKVKKATEVISQRRRKTWLSKVAKRVPNAIGSFFKNGLGHPIKELWHCFKPMPTYRKMRCILSAFLGWPFALVSETLAMLASIPMALADAHTDSLKKVSLPQISNVFKPLSKANQNANAIAYVLGKTDALKDLKKASDGQKKFKLLTDLWKEVQTICPEITVYYQEEIGAILSTCSNKAVQKFLRYDNNWIRTNLTRFDMQTFLAQKTVSPNALDAVLIATHDVVFKAGFQRNLYLFALQNRHKTMTQFVKDFDQTPC